MFWENIWLFLKKKRFLVEGKVISFSQISLFTGVM